MDTSVQGSGSIVRSSIVASRATDPGSNPGRSTNLLVTLIRAIDDLILGASLGQNADYQRAGDMGLPSQHRAEDPSQTTSNVGEK